MKVGIIGGGIAGLSTALALQKAGIDFHLFEQSPEFREVGAGIMLSSSTRYLLQKLGVGNSFDKASLPINAFTITNHLLQKVRAIPAKEVGYAIHRAKIIEVLSTPLLPHQYTLNARIEHVQQSVQQVTVQVNNTSYNFDILIAADGIHSAIRKQFLPGLTLRYTGQTMWRGMSTIQLPKKFHNSVHEMWGNNKRFGIMHKQGDEYFWYCIRWAKEGEQDTSNVKEYLLNLFAEYHTTVHELIKSGNNIMRTDLRDIEHGIFPWFNNSIAFVGDSIHATTPHISQGACQAIESAYTIAACLKKYPDNIQLAFSTYQQLRTKKTKFISEYSYLFGRFSHQRKAWLDKALHAAFKLVPASLLRQFFNQTVDLKYLKGIEI